MAVAIVEPTTLLRDWLRDEFTNLNVYAGGLPNPYVVADDGPAVVLWRVGGGFADTGEGVNVGLYQLDCFDTNARDAASLAGGVQRVLFNAAIPVALSSLTRLCGWSQIAGRPDFDQDPEFARYIVTAQATTISATPE